MRILSSASIAIFTLIARKPVSISEASANLWYYEGQATEAREARGARKKVSSRATIAPARMSRPKITPIAYAAEMLKANHPS